VNELHVYKTVSSHLPILIKKKLPPYLCDCGKYFVLRGKVIPVFATVPFLIYLHALTTTFTPSSSVTKLGLERLFRPRLTVSSWFSKQSSSICSTIQHYVHEVFYHRMHVLPAQITETSNSETSPDSFEVQSHIKDDVWQRGTFPSLLLTLPPPAVTSLSPFLAQHHNQPLLVHSVQARWPTQQCQYSAFIAGIANMQHKHQFITRCVSS